MPYFQKKKCLAVTIVFRSHFHSVCVKCKWTNMPIIYIAKKYLFESFANKTKHVIISFVNEILNRNDINVSVTESLDSS